MLTVRAWVSCGWTSRQIDKKKKQQQQQQRTNKHISLITLTSLYPKKQSRTGLRYFQLLLLFFTSGQLREIHFKKRNPHRVLRLVCWGVRKPNFKANCMVYIVYYCVVKSMFFFSFCLPTMLTNNALPTLPTTNRNTEVSCVVSGDSQQKHILRIIDARTRPQLNNLLNGNLD